MGVTQTVNPALGAAIMEGEGLGLIIRRIAHAAKKDTDNNLKKWELTMSQAIVLEFLNNSPEDELTQRAVEQHFNLRHPTVSGILKRLERSGFIRTAPSDSDRRIKRIFLTDKAREVDAKAKQHQATIEETFVRGMTPEEIETLRRLLTKVLHNMTGG